MGIESVEFYEVHCDGDDCSSYLGTFQYCEIDEKIKSSGWKAHNWEVYCKECMAKLSQKVAYEVCGYGSLVHLKKSFGDPEESSGFFSFEKAKEIAIETLNRNYNEMKQEWLAKEKEFSSQVQKIAALEEESFK